MPNSPPTISTLVGQPTMRDVLNQLKKEIFLTLNCHALATVQSFNSTDQSISANINYSKTVVQLVVNPSNGAKSYQEQQINYPVLVDVPIVSLCGGKAVLTMPIAAGDQCLILFNDRDIDNWFNGVHTGEVATTRLHSFSDGIALVGLNDVSSYDTVRALLTNGNVKLGINPSNNKVLISNTVAGSLGSILSTFFTSTSVATTAAQIATAAGVALTGIGELLE